jgi:hypothetical protein
MNPNSTLLNSSDLDAKFGTPTLLPLSLFIEHEEKGQLCAQRVPPRSPRVHGKLIGQVAIGYYMPRASLLHLDAFDIMKMEDLDTKIRSARSRCVWAQTT